VTRAGAAVRDKKVAIEDLVVIDLWRAAHRPVLNTFNALLRNRAKGLEIKVGYRHKRKRTIFNKLLRFPKMELARMDDIAGCRLIFTSIDELYSFRNGLHKASFNHRRRNDVDKYDYIKAPKSTGYRGIHDIFEYDVRSAKGAAALSKGLYVEIQYRTAVQHAWATAVEVIGNITENQPKFREGDKRYERIMLLASEILARAMEGCNSYLPEYSSADLVEEFARMDTELGLLNLLRGLNAVQRDVSANRNVILIFSEDEELESKSYRDATEALAALFQLERENPGKDIVLVRADTAEEVRIAFRNYFSDAREFIQLIEDSCERLSGHAIDHVDEATFRDLSM
jgi:putative GTP pyrophosphokinase